MSNTTFAHAPVCSPMFWWEPRLIVGVRLENEAGKGNLFKAVKHFVRQGKDVVGNSSMKTVKGAQGSNKSEAGCVELDDGSKFELVDKFCYLGDVLHTGGEQRKLQELEYGQLGESLMS